MAAIETLVVENEPNIPVIRKEDSPALARGEPMRRGAWPASGTHVDAVGASVASCRALDADWVRRARICLGHLPMAPSSAQDIVVANQLYASARSAGCGFTLGFERVRHA